jgi:hypothetical protein
LRGIVHLILHVLVPGAVAWRWWPHQWGRAWVVMLATMLVDLDHLVATPRYDPDRCSIGFHPLHTYPMFALYAALLFFPRTRLIGAGLVIHMILDGLDCVLILRTIVWGGALAEG